MLFGGLAVPASPAGATAAAPVVSPSSAPALALDAPDPDIVLVPGGIGNRASIGRSGIVSVNISVGASKASGNGRLAGNTGAGRWSGIILGDRCSGSWQATRS